MKLSEYQEIIRPRLSDYRYRHSVNVAAQARHLAELYGGDPQKAETAGILHDIMKDTDPQEQLRVMTESGIALSEVEQSSHKLWHAISGAAFVRTQLGITDEDILNAIRYHTTGRAGMSVLERIVFIADFTSAEREFDGADKLKKLVEKDLREAILAGLTFTIRDLAGRGKTIHPDAIAAYNDMLLHG